MNRILYFDRFFDRIERNRNREIRQSKLKAELKRITDEAEITRQYERYKAELESLNPATVRRLSKEDELVEREKDRDVISEAALENLENLENPVSLTTINDNRDTIGFSRQHSNKGGWSNDLDHITPLVYDNPNLLLQQEPLPDDIEGYTPEETDEQCISQNWLYATRKDGTLVRQHLKCTRDSMCDVCRIKYKNTIYRKIMYGLDRIPDNIPIHFVTLTMPDLPNEYDAQGHLIKERLRDQFDRFCDLWREIRRNLPKFTFVRVFEFGEENNRIHAHLLVVGDCPFPVAPNAEGDRTQWIMSLSPDALSRYNYLVDHGLGIYSCERLQKGKHAAAAYISKYLAKTDNFPWKDIKGIRLYGTSKDFPQPPDRPTPFDIKCPAYTQDPDEEQAQEIPEHKPMQYLTYDQDQRLDIIQQDISFQLEGVTAPDTITEPYAEIQDLTTQLNKLRNYIPNEILQVIQSETYKQEYVITQHNTETDNLDYYRFYHRRPPPAGAFDPPESVKPYLDDFIYIYNTLQYAKRRLRERHNYTGTFRFLRFFIVAMSEPAHHAKSKRRIESHYYEYYRMTGRDPDKDGIPYRMLVAMSCVDNDPTAGQNHIDPHIQQTLI